jgi:integrase/recombinase XerD
MSKAVVIRPRKPTVDWERIIPIWLHGRPAITCERYAPVIRDFREFVKSKTIGTVRLEDLQAFQDTLAGQKEATIRRKMSTIKSLLSFSHKTGLIPFNVGAALRMPVVLEQLTEKILPEEDIHAMINGEPNPRNQVLLRVLYGSGIRATEASGLDWKDVQPRDSGGQLVVLGKGSKVRVIRISPQTWKALLAIRPNDATPADPVFVTDQERRMSRNYISILVRRAARRIGIGAKVSAHWLRHGHASHSMDKGAPLSLIQKTLGHTDLTTTSRYLHVRPTESSSKYLGV